MDYYGLLQSQIDANNAWNAEQAQKQMDFQERMSNTAHQREIEDLKASGLNPVLSAKLGGASTPTGAKAEVDPSGTASLTSLLEKMMDVESMNAEANLIRAGYGSGFGYGSGYDVGDEEFGDNLIYGLLIGLGIPPRTAKEIMNLSLNLEEKGKEKADNGNAFFKFLSNPLASVADFGKGLLAWFNGKETGNAKVDELSKKANDEIMKAVSGANAWISGKANSAREWIKATTNDKYLADAIARGFGTYKNPSKDDVYRANFQLNYKKPNAGVNMKSYGYNAKQALNGYMKTKQYVMKNSRK